MTAINEVNDIEKHFSNVVAGIVNGKAYPVGMVGDVLRYLPHRWANPALLQKMAAFDGWLNDEHHSAIPPLNMYTANDMTVDYINGVWTGEDVIAYNTHSGYSVSGLCGTTSVKSVDLVFLFDDGAIVYEYMWPEDEDEG